MHNELLVPMVQDVREIFPYDQDSYIDPEVWDLIDHDDETANCLTRWDDPMYPGCAGHGACRDCCWEEFLFDMWVHCGAEIGGGGVIGCLIACLATGPAYPICVALCGGGVVLAVGICGAKQNRDLNECQYQCDRIGRVRGCLPI